MPTPNLYWPVYMNLEKEFLELAKFIHFSDDQIKIYAVKGEFEISPFTA